MARVDGREPARVPEEDGEPAEAQDPGEPFAPRPKGGRLVAAVARGIVQGLARTIPLAAEVNAGFVRDRVGRGRGAVVFAMWHDRLLYLAQYLSMRYAVRQHPTVVLVSSSGDGALIAHVIRALRSRVAWGSTTRGGVAGAHALVRLARGPRPHSPILTVDGPRGPRHLVKPGVVAVARATGLPVVPISVGFGRAFTLAAAWDGFVVPWPTTPARVIHGDPIAVAPDADAGAALAAVQAGMDAVTRAAERGERRVPIGRRRGRGSPADLPGAESAR